MKAGDSADAPSLGPTRPPDRSIRAIAFARGILAPSQIPIGEPAHEGRIRRFEFLPSRIGQHPMLCGGLRSPAKCSHLSFETFLLVLGHYCPPCRPSRGRAAVASGKIRPTGSFVTPLGTHVYNPRRSRWRPLKLNPRRKSTPRMPIAGIPRASHRSRVSGQAQHQAAYDMVVKVLVTQQSEQASRPWLVAGAVPALRSDPAALPGRGDARVRPRCRSGACSRRSPLDASGNRPAKAGTEYTSARLSVSYDWTIVSGVAPHRKACTTTSSKTRVCQRESPPPAPLSRGRSRVRPWSCRNSTLP